MKIFLFSRRFLIPFFLTLMLSEGFMIFRLWQTYRDDFKGKELPDSLIFEWLGYQAGTLLVFSFLLAFLVGIAYYSQRYLSRQAMRYRPFRGLSLLIVISVSIAGFIYASFGEPRCYHLGRGLLTEIVFYRKGTPFNYSPGDSKTPGTMNLRELIREKRRKQAVTAYVGNKKETLKRINYEIAKKAAVPFYIFLFFITGVLLGAVFRKSYAVFPVLISWFVIFPAWYYATTFFESQYKQEKLSPFWSVFAPVTIFSLLAIVGSVVLINKGILRGKPVQELLLGNQ